MPKNILTIPSVNSIDWIDYNTSPTTLVSSSTSTIPTSGITKSSTSQNFFFSLNASYADITKFSDTFDTNLTDSSGLLILMNPIIKSQSPYNLLVATSNIYTNLSTNTYNSPNFYNNYTYISLTSIKSQGLTNIFDLNPSSIATFGISNFSIV